MGLPEVITAQKQDKARGITAICTANAWVLKAAMRRAVQTGETLLIESTCNQVNQFGGYTGLTPADFVAFVRRLANENGLAREQLLLGGDHLGPTLWQNEPETSAMEKSAQMVKAYVQAGYHKLHLDATAGLNLNPNHPCFEQNLMIAARRTAFLAHMAEETCAALGSSPPCYVIGAEVPIPGGATGHEVDVAVSTAQDVSATIEVTHAAFRLAGLEEAWERVIAVVVQPGVEFGDDFVLDYHPEKANELARLIESEPRIIYEAHSTDYQTREALQNLVRDHFAILKVGPALTFALREAIFALAAMENELFRADSRSNLISVIDEAMLRDPRHWQKHYQGTAQEQSFKRKFSLSDRIRYYWQDEKVQAAFAKLLFNLKEVPPPRSLLSQYAPWFLEHQPQGEKENTPEELLFARVENVLKDYECACLGFF